MVGASLCFLLLFVYTGGFQPTTGGQNQSPPYSQPGGSTINITPIPDDPTLAEAVAAKTLPSVVNIDVYIRTPAGYSGTSPSWDDSTSDRNLMEYSLGSGVVLTEDGYILTNYHVVEGGDEFMVRFDADTQLRATLFGADPSSDLAILKVNATGLTPIDIGDSSALAVGEWVMALGSPFGLDKTVSVGVVSALFRSTTLDGVNELTIYANMIQTDAAINPGNSGGALVNKRGELIGINTLIVTPTGSSAGIGFAIPINYAYNVAQQIMDGKKVEHAFLGVHMTTIDPSNANKYGSTVNAGAYIDQVVSGSPAEHAGLRRGDIIVKVGNTRVGTATEVVLEIRGYFVGDTVSVEIVRNGETMLLEVMLGSDVDNY